MVPIRILIRTTVVPIRGVIGTTVVQIIILIGTTEPQPYSFSEFYLMLLLFIVQLSLLPFPFDLRTSRNVRTYDNYGHFTEYSRNIHRFTDERQLRTFHGTFTDLRKNGIYGTFTEYSRIYECHGTVRE